MIFLSPYDEFTNSIVLEIVYNGQYTKYLKSQYQQLAWT